MGWFYDSEKEEMRKLIALQVEKISLIENKKPEYVVVPEPTPAQNKQYLKMLAGFVEDELMLWYVQLLKKSFVDELARGKETNIEWFRGAIACCDRLGEDGSRARRQLAVEAKDVEI